MELPLDPFRDADAPHLGHVARARTEGEPAEDMDDPRVVARGGGLRAGRSSECRRR
jgi:hypothetical protein